MLVIILMLLRKGSPVQAFRPQRNPFKPSSFGLDDDVRRSGDAHERHGQYTSMRGSAFFDERAVWTFREIEIQDICSPVKMDR